MSGYQPFQPVTLPDYGQTLARMAQIDAQRQQIEIARQGQKQEQAFNQGLATLAPALASGQGAEYSSALATLAGLGPRGAQMALPLLQQERSRQEAADFWRTGGMGGAAPVAPAGGGGGAPGGDYVTRTVAVENNPDRPDYRPDARNPRSSATGDGQFIDGTWLEFAAANPQRFQGMTREQILAARADPALSREAIGWYRDRNLRDLQAQGLPANDTTAALAHRFGPEGAARLLRSDPNAPIGQVVGPQVMAANPDLEGRTVGQVMGQYAQRFGAAASTPAGAPAAPRGINPQELALIERAMAHPNPQVRQQGEARLRLLQLRQQNNPETYREETRTIGGRQVVGQVNTRTGQFTAYPGQTERQQNDGPFANGETGQAGAYLNRIAPRIQSGEATPEEVENFRAAYALWTRERIDPTTQQRIPGLPATPGVQRALDALSQRERTTGPQPGADVTGQPVSANPLAQPPRIETDPAGNSRVVQPAQTTAQAREAARRMEVEVGRVNDAAQNFIKALDDAGGTGIAAFLNNPQSPSAVRINTAYNNLVTALRSEAFLNTGVLQPGEVAMISRNFLDPQSLRGLLASRDAYRAQMAELQRFITAGLNRARAAADLPSSGGEARGQGGGDTVPLSGGVQADPPAPAPRRAPPTIGTVQDGYRFRGGDPSRRENWERVR